MPLSRRMSHRQIVAELIRSYRSTGKIGKTRPKNINEAMDIANAIAYDLKNREPKRKRRGWEK